MMREFLTSQILRRIVHQLEIDPKEAPLRSTWPPRRWSGWR